MSCPLQCSRWASTADLARRAVFSLMLWCVTAGAQTPAEYDVKAAMLYRFAQFLEWPTNRISAPDAPVVFGIVGQDPFGPRIDALLRDQKVGQRPVRIERFSITGALTNTHLLFVSNSVNSETEKLLASVRTHPVLTVGETEDFTRKGGHIRLYIDAKKPRFEINLAALERSGLKMHSQVLKLATRVSRDGKDVEQ